MVYLSPSEILITYFFFIAKEAALEGKRNKKNKSPLAESGVTERQVNIGSRGVPIPSSSPVTREFI